MRSFSIVVTGFEASEIGRLQRSDSWIVSVSNCCGATVCEFTLLGGRIEYELQRAISAIRESGATVHRVEPDNMVSQAEIAVRSGLTRQAISNYVMGIRGRNFPAPTARCTTSSPLWDWSIVAEWMYSRRMVDRNLVMNARLIRRMNDVLTQGKLPSW